MFHIQSDHFSLWHHPPFKFHFKPVMFNQQMSLLHLHLAFIQNDLQKTKKSITFGTFLTAWPIYFFHNVNQLETFHVQRWWYFLMVSGALPAPSCFIRPGSGVRAHTVIRSDMWPVQSPPPPAFFVCIFPKAATPWAPWRWLLPPTHLLTQPRGAGWKPNMQILPVQTGRWGWHSHNRTGFVPPHFLSTFTILNGRAQRWRLNVPPPPTRTHTRTHRHTRTHTDTHRLPVSSLTTDRCRNMADCLLSPATHESPLYICLSTLLLLHPSH